MKRRALIRHLENHGCLFLREGTKHTIYWNPRVRKTSSVPRHTEIPEPLARKICKDLDVAEPR
jgi:predicted RNA binding protein YcfA (HicA-like mRNA interferase family)